MPKEEVFQHSILIISASEVFASLVRKSLAPGLFQSVEFRKSAALARRAMLERFYDMVVINAPLPDENGIRMALDAAEKYSASVLLVVPREAYADALERVTDAGVMTIFKPSPKGTLDKALRFLTAVRNRFRALEKKAERLEEKLEETRLVSRAKCMLIEKKGICEDDAHRLIGKMAMDHGISRGRAAQMIMDDSG